MRCIDCGEWHDGDSDLCPSCRKKYTEKLKEKRDCWVCPICGVSVRFSYWARKNDILSRRICCSPHCSDILRALEEKEIRK